MILRSIIAGSTIAARCSSSVFRSTVVPAVKPCFRRELPIAYYYAAQSSLPMQSAINGQYYHQGRSEVPQPLIIPGTVVIAALAITSTTDNKPPLSYCQDIDEQPRPASQQPHPDSWVRKTHQNKPHMIAWLALMNEVGHYFPAKGTNKKIGTNSKVIYTDWVLRFHDWDAANPKHGAGAQSDWKLLAIPPDLTIDAAEAHRVRAPLPEYLTKLPAPDIGRLVSFLKAQFVVQPGAKEPKFSPVSKAQLRLISIRNNHYDEYICLTNGFLARTEWEESGNSCHRKAMGVQV